MSRLIIPAYAKVNLGLRVLRRRPDGFHDIVTVYQRLSLCDVVAVELTGGDEVYIGPPLTDAPEENLAIRAVDAFRKRFGLRRGVRVELTKRIPSGAGLGGGSSDAAAVLKALAQMRGIATDEPELFRVAENLGADVPFFLSGWSAALGCGKGEALEQRKGLSREAWAVVLVPDFKVSTREAYKWVDECLTFNEDKNKIYDCIFRAYAGGAPAPELANDFEGPVTARHPELAEALLRLRSCGAIYASLSGSGSAVFGLFDGQTEAGSASRGWSAPWRTLVCRPC